MFSQDNRFISVATPLGNNVLLFSRMSGHEEMSRLFEYSLDLLAEPQNLSQISADKLLGKAMTIAMDLPAGGSRYFNGLVTQFKHHGIVDGRCLFRATLRPWLWFLTRTSDCRIFQEQSVPDIIKKVFSLNGFNDFKFELTGSYSPRTYCVQYRETDFNFVSRLMEHEGIFYFFTHENGVHTLVVADSSNAHQPVANYATISYYPPENDAQRDEDHIFDWQMAYSVQSGAYTLNDYDFEKPKGDLIAKLSNPKSHVYASGEQYDYPGTYIDPKHGEHYADIRLHELQTGHEVIQGQGNTMGLTTGMLFKLKGHYLHSENTQHVVMAADFFIEGNSYRSNDSGGLSYQCSFKAIRATQPFRPARLTPVPFVQGPQTATVVGKQGEEIWTDQYGRVKVQFHWEREGKRNETSSCWIRVATPVAGKNWGWVSLPRIGQEVVVSFLEGNPDQPLITGSVYNANQMPPYSLPANQTQSGIKSRSSKGGTHTHFNEFRFEDKKGHEQVYLHAEKHLDTVVESSESRSVGGSRTTTIHQNETLTIKEGDRKETLEKGSDSVNLKLGDYKMDIDAGRAIITAMTSIELIVGSNSIKLDQSGITINGMIVKIKGATTLDATSPMTTVKADAILTLKGGMVMIN